MNAMLRQFFNDIRNFFFFVKHNFQIFSNKIFLKSFNSVLLVFLRLSTMGYRFTEIIS